MAGPLSGIRILDHAPMHKPLHLAVCMPRGGQAPADTAGVLHLSTTIAGSCATQVLGDMGAEVIKIEPPQGDIMRSAGPRRSP